MNVLIWGDTETSPALRREVPLSIGDPFLYLETDGRRVVMTNAIEEGRLARDVPELERLMIDFPVALADRLRSSGVRVEDLLVVTENEAESLTAALPLDLAP